MFEHRDHLTWCSGPSHRSGIDFVQRVNNVFVMQSGIRLAHSGAVTGVKRRGWGEDMDPWTPVDKAGKRPTACVAQVLEDHFKH